MKPIRLSLLISSLMLSLLVSVALPGLAYADEGTPPTEPAPTEEVTSEPASEATSTEDAIPMAGTPVVEETPSAEETASTEETPITDNTSVEQALAVTDELTEEEMQVSEETTAVTELLEGTEIVVLNENGEQLPLASEEAAELIEIVDPMWCPVGVTPGAVTCSAAFNSLYDLVNNFVPTANGVIWIQAGTDNSTTDGSGGSIVIDGADFGVGGWGPAAGFSLTLKGGWSGANNTIINSGTPSLFDNSISIVGWANDITLSDIVIDNNIAGAVGLTITTSGKVTLTRVDATNNDNGGAQIDNTSGIKDVVITSSEFSTNGVGFAEAGLVVQSNGAITLSNVTANGNGWHGASLDNNGGVGKSVILTGTNIFGDNETTGLVINSNGAIKINNTFANSNGFHGAELNNIGDGNIAQPVTFTSSNEFKFNTQSGLLIESNGLVTLNSINASGNELGKGVSVNNRNSTFAKNVVMTGTNIFNSNGYIGLEIISYGSITLNNVTARYNDSIGVNLDNCDDFSGCQAPSPKSVIVTGTNNFSDNGTDGLVIESFGAVSLANVTANDNLSGDGIQVVNRWNSTIQQNVTITGTTNANGNDGWGVYIDTYGVVTLGAVFASYNDSGIFIENDSGTLPKNVTLGNTTVNSNSVGYGLEVYSKGAVKASNVQANGNISYGAFIDNNGDGAVGGVTITGINSFSNTDNGPGLVVLSLGAITLYNFDANDNNETGVFLNNSLASGANISVITTLANWCNGISGNGDSGFYAVSHGAISVSNLCTGGEDDPGNGDYGVYLVNDGANPLSPKPITLSGTNTIYNSGKTGLYIRSLGAVTLSKVTSSKNGTDIDPLVDNAEEWGFGVYLYNLGNQNVPQNVTLSGYVTVEENVYAGLEVRSYGAISVANIYAYLNGWGDATTVERYGYGALLENNSGLLVKPVTVSGSNYFANNWSGGLLIESLGAIKANNLEADNNGALSFGGNGVTLSNAADPAVPQNVTLTGYARFSSNEDGSGLEVNTFGLIAAAQLFSENNGNYGVKLDNSAGNLPRAVNLLGANVFNDNGTGLRVDSLGLITVSNLYAENNDNSGVELYNNYPLATGGVTINGTNTFIENFDGLLVFSRGAIKVNNLRAYENTFHGVELDNSIDALLSATVTITGNQIFDSNNTGLVIHSQRLIAINSVTSSNNWGGFGVFIDNSFSGTALLADVKFTGTNTFTLNNWSGLEVRSYSAISLNNMTASGNGLDELAGFGYGVYLNNSEPVLTFPALVSKGVTLTGTNTFEDNFEDGLHVESYGLIKANALTANGNDGDGVHLDNQWGQSNPGGVTLTGTNNFEDNAFDGLEIKSNRTITLNNINANSNDVRGLVLDNQCSCTLANVVITGTNTFNVNGDYGLSIGIGLLVNSEGAITINNLTANGNGDTGAQLTNDIYPVSPAKPNVTLTGVNNFIGNKFNGLVIDSFGVVSLSKVTADDNEFGDGVRVNTDGNITITCGSATVNGDAGFELTSSFGTITLKGVVALGNGGLALDTTGITSIIRSC